MKLKLAILAGVASALVLASASAASAQGAKGADCADKGGRGWGASLESARFQAWEAVLQGTDWGMWAAWMASGAKVGAAASGYRVSNVREKCENDPAGKVCLIRARLCK